MSSYKSLQEYLESLPEWKDEMKTRSMFASFSQPRSVNPEAWDARFDFWRSVLQDSVHCGLLDSSVFTISNPRDLIFHFTRNHITPLGLTDVIVRQAFMIFYILDGNV